MEGSKRQSPGLGARWTNLELGGRGKRALPETMADEALAEGRLDPGLGKAPKNGRPLLARGGSHGGHLKLGQLRLCPRKGHRDAGWEDRQVRPPPGGRTEQALQDEERGDEVFLRPELGKLRLGSLQACVAQDRVATPTQVRSSGRKGSWRLRSSGRALAPRLRAAGGALGVRWRLPPSAWSSISKAVSAGHRRSDGQAPGRPGRRATHITTSSGTEKTRSPSRTASVARTPVPMRGKTPSDTLLATAA